MNLTLTFGQKKIPLKYICSNQKGLDISPGISWKAVPKAKSYVLIVEDPDAPIQNGFVHWILQNIPSNITSIPELQQQKEKIFYLKKGRIIQGLNSWGRYSYGGPCPPPDGKIHHYYFKIFALDTCIEYGTDCKQKDCMGVTRDTLQILMNNHIIAYDERCKIYQNK